MKKADQEKFNKMLKANARINAKRMIKKNEEGKADKGNTENKNSTDKPKNSSKKNQKKGKK